MARSKDRVSNSQTLREKVRAKGGDRPRAGRRGQSLDAVLACQSFLTVGPQARRPLSLSGLCLTQPWCAHWWLGSSRPGPSVLPSPADASAHLSPSAQVSPGAALAMAGKVVVPAPTLSPLVLSARLARSIVLG